MFGFGSFLFLLLDLYSLLFRPFILIISYHFSSPSFLFWLGGSVACVNIRRLSTISFILCSLYQTTARLSEQHIEYFASAIVCRRRQRKKEKKKKKTKINRRSFITLMLPSDKYDEATRYTDKFGGSISVRRISHDAFGKICMKPSMIRPIGQQN